MSHTRFPQLRLASFTTALLIGQAPAQEPTESPIVITVIGLEARPSGHHEQMLRAVKLLTASWNGTGQIRGRRILVAEARCANNSKSIRAVVDKCKKSAGTNVLITPLESDVAAALRKAARRKIPCVSIDHRPETILERVGHYANEVFCARRIAIVHDRNSKDLVRAMQKNPPYPMELIADLRIDVKSKTLIKKLRTARPDLLVIDAGPKATATFLDTTWANQKIDTMLTPRCLGHQLLDTKTEITTAILLGRSQIGATRFGATEGRLAGTTLLRALEHVIEGGSDLTTARITKALEGNSPETHLALWRIRDGAFVPEAESVGRPASPSGETAKLGDRLGTRHSHEFLADSDAHCVVFGWGGAESTIDSDLRELGLSTRGECPILDRRIRDDLMARILSITSTIFVRNPDGTSIPGKSPNISFTTKLRGKNGRSKSKIWYASFFGDDASTGGRSSGNRCEVFPTHFRRTIFAKHAIVPPVGVEDLRYLDGRHQFGQDANADRRGELIRALINSYAGAMALTAAHEIGRLSGLGEVSAPPEAIMNVKGSAGIDFRDGKFTSASLEKLVRRFGVAK